MDWRHLAPGLWLVVVHLLGLVMADSDRMTTHRIFEDLPTDTFIANIVLDAKLDLKYSPNDLRLLHFTLHDRRGASQNFRQYFHIEERTGILRTAKVIDRETICPHRLNCPIHLNVMVQPGQFFQIIKVLLEIIDTNDNAPLFPQNLVVRTISETTMPGAKFALPSAEDDDSGVFGIQRYQLVSDSEKFELRVTNSTEGDVDLHLVLKGKLDREVEESFVMEVVAMDGGNPPKSGAMMVQVSVLDANDNNPKFNNYTYEVTISENTPIGSTILQLHAHDPDKGANGKVEYKFDVTTQAQNGGLFGIDNETGEIFIKGPIDYERGNIYYLTVTAKDHGPNSLPAYAKVVVKVEDVNDHAPHITVNALTNTGYVEVSESAEVGTFVAHVSVADFDSGTSGEFNCRMDSDQFRLQKLYATEFKIITTTTFDREMHAEYHLNMVCTDQGNPPKTATEHIIVTILDANDHAPVFQHRVYTAELRENNEVGAFITQVVALDTDSGKNAQVKYSIADDDRRLLSVNENTGIIRAIVHFDYERDHELEFVVEAKDQGSPQKTARALLRLIIIDANDNKPVFSQVGYAFEVMENMREKTFVGTVIAADKDSAPYNQITYSLHPDYDGLRSFSINPYTGEITTKRELDREEQARYLLVIVASNDGYPMMRSLTNVTVYILDHNDNAPILDYPSEWNNTVHISRAMPVGGTVAQIKAHDLDSNQNAELSYSIFDGNGGEYFLMNSTSGVIYLNKKLETEGYQYHKMKVVVKDHGKPEKQAMGDFNIVVNKSLAVIQYQNSGFSFLRLKDSNVIIGGIIAIFAILVCVLVVVIIKCRRKRNPRQKYNCRQAAKKRDGKKKDRRESLEWKAVPNDWCDKDNKPKKAVTFRMEVEEGEGEDASQQLWPPNVDSDCNQKSNCYRDSDATTSCDEDGFSSIDRRNYLSTGSVRRFPQPEPTDNHHPHPNHYSSPRGPNYPPLTKAELEMHEMLQLLHQDGDSETGSYTDSGRGPSEEGDNATHTASLDPHPPDTDNKSGAASGDGTDPGPWQHRYPASRSHHPGGHLRSFQPQPANHRQLRNQQNNAQHNNNNRTAAGVEDTSPSKKSDSSTQQHHHDSSSASNGDLKNSNSDSEPLWVPQTPENKSSSKDGARKSQQPYKSQSGTNGPLLSNQNGSLGNNTAQRKLKGGATIPSGPLKSNGAIRTESGEKEYVLLAARFADEESGEENSEADIMTSGSYMVDQDNNPKSNNLGGQSKVTRDVTV